MKKYFLIIILIFFSLGADALVVGTPCGQLNMVCAQAVGQNERKCYCKYIQETTTYTCGNGNGFQFDSSTNKCKPTSTTEDISNGHVVYEGKAECDPTETKTQQTCYRSETCDTDCGDGVMATECTNGGFTPLG